ncbi:hypothetical protein OIU77_025630 [Salix suchowensis]|uniref:Uncharacterized protein n=1 Tax=Salix suchowensis TaxID=1278906 RepID=A0ABQ9BWX5_9ROSI|nr:hypothetical protein OIU77_025630 [Salix suchowensis]
MSWGCPGKYYNWYLVLQCLKLTAEFPSRRQFY